MQQTDVVYGFSDSTPSYGPGLVEHVVKYGNGRGAKDVSGYVETPYGVVKVSSHYMMGKPKYDSSTLEIIKNQRVHYRHFNRAFNKKGLIEKAAQFAKELNG